MYKNEVQDEELLDIFVMIAIHHLALKDERRIYKNEKDIVIDNTTNAIDGGVFSPMKKLIKIHNGFTKSLKIKMLADYSLTLPSDCIRKLHLILELANQ